MEKSAAVILAGGRGNRLRPLTDTVPKPLLQIGHTTPLENTLVGVSPYVEEIILVIGYLGEKVKQYLGNSFQGISIKYVWQSKPLGTGHALNCVKNEVSHDNFFFVYGDDFYDKALFSKIALKKRAVIGKKENNWQRFGVFKLRRGKYLQEVVEKPEDYISNLVNVGLYKVDQKIFPYFRKIKKSVRGEYEFTDMLSLYAQDFPVEVIKCSDGWIPLTSLDDLKKATKYLHTRQTI